MLPLAQPELDMSLAEIVSLKPFVERLASRSRLGAEEQQAMLGLPAYPVRINANRDFVGLRAKVDHANFIVSGLVGQFGQNREGIRQITAVHLPTDIVGLHSLVWPDACSALQALSLTTVLCVPHVALRAIAIRYPAIAEAFWRECAVDAAILAEWVINIGRRDAKSRIAHLLCEVVCRVESASGVISATVPFPATQAHIADMTGLTPIHVNRTLRRLREENVVDHRDQTIQILDRAGLFKTGDFDGSYLRFARIADDRGGPPQDRRIGAGVLPKD